MNDETIIITKNEYDILNKLKEDYIRLFSMYLEAMRLHDNIVRTYEEMCAKYEKALRM